MGSLLTPLRLGGILAAGIFALSLALSPRHSSKAAAPKPVSLELVLAVDVSASVDAAEYQLQMQGLANAFRRPQIISAILQHGQGVAISLVQWSDRAEHSLEPPWRMLNNKPGILALADEIEEAGRRNVGHYTAIGNAMGFAIQSLETNAYQGHLRKIDVSGDGQNNLGEPSRNARQRALARGITVNGLVILTDEPRLGDHYERLVIGGPGAFVLQARTYDDFADAIARKLLRELTIRLSSR